jgi:hypothetical protein
MVYCEKKKKQSNVIAQNCPALIRFDARVLIKSERGFHGNARSVIRNDSLFVAYLDAKRSWNKEIGRSSSETEYQCNNIEGGRRIS